MKFYVHTNIDKFRSTKWPEDFCYPPKVGEKIEGIGPGNSKPVLEIVAVIHSWDNRLKEPFLDIELHVPKNLGKYSLKELGWDH